MEHSILYIFHGRFPDPRAAAIFAVEEVKSLSTYVPITMIVPKRDTTDLEKARTLYKLPEQVKLVALPVVDVSRVPLVRFFAFVLSILTFSYNLSTFLRHSKSKWVITTDHLPALIAKWCGKKVLIEVHDFPSTWNPIWRLLLARADIVLSTNNWKGDELHSRFKVPRERIFVERNGVDFDKFTSSDKTDARRKLGLPLEASIALYTGNLYAWKGVDTLVDAAVLVPEVLVYIVGGSDADRVQLMKRAKNSNNVHFVGRVSHEEIPLWQSAADVLVLPNTATEEISAHHTSPMKLFEYMASQRPIVASDLPSIREILPYDAGLFCAPDDTKELATTIRKAIAEPEESKHRANRAREAVDTNTWDARARRLIKRL